MIQKLRPETEGKRVIMSIDHLQKPFLLIRGPQDPGSWALVPSDERTEGLRTTVLYGDIFIIMVIL
jgi:hypothetical protein